MNHNVEEQVQANAQLVYEPLEFVEQLYVARIPATPGEIISDNGEPVETSQQGEIRLYGEVSNSVFTMLQIRRIALAGTVVKPSREEPFGLFSIVGPLGQPDVKQSGAGQITNLRFELNYKELSILGLNERVREREQDAYFPPVVRLLGTMTWEQRGEPRSDGVTLAVKLEFFDDAEANVGRRNRVRTLSFSQELELHFVWAGAPASRGQAEQNIFAAARAFSSFPCAKSTTPCAQDAQENVRKLPLRLINLSTKADQANSHEIFDKQLLGICKVWREKALLDFVMTLDVLQGTLEQIEKYKEFLPVRWEEFLNDVELTSVDQIDVCLVDDVLDDAASLPGGAYTYDGRQNSAAVFLRVEQAISDDYLLAHELGHVLGLGDSDLGMAGTNIISADGLTIMVGSPDSVMTPGINSDKNSRTNCDIFASALVNPLVSNLDPVEKDCLRPDFL